jgi:hypothetical protein
MDRFSISIIIAFTGILGFCCQNRGNNPSSAKELNWGEITDDSLLTLTEYRTFNYFWDGAEPANVIMLTENTPKTI